MKSGIENLSIDEALQVMKKNEVKKNMLEKRGAEIMRELVKDNMSNFMNFQSSVRVAQKVKKGELNPNHSKEVQQEFIDKYTVSDELLTSLESLSELLYKVASCYYGENEKK